MTRVEARRFNKFRTMSLQSSNTCRRNRTTMPRIRFLIPTATMASTNSMHSQSSMSLDPSSSIHVQNARIHTAASSRVNHNKQSFQMSRRRLATPQVWHTSTPRVTMFNHVRSSLRITRRALSLSRLPTKGTQLTDRASASARQSRKVSRIPTWAEVTQSSRAKS